jgi:hypothetical protein
LKDSADNQDNAANKDRAASAKLLAKDGCEDSTEKASN